MMLSTPAFAQKVSVEYDHQVDFSKYKTYRWGKNKGELPDASDDAHIKQKLDAMLQARDLNKVATRQSDVVVTYQATVKQHEREIDTYEDDDDIGFGTGWGMGWGWGWGDMDPVYPVTELTQIQEGDLLVDILDPATKSIVFRGYARGAFHSDPVKEDQLMSKALEKMFKNFPPKEK
jgi:hypothetical protein